METIERVKRLQSERRKFWFDDGLEYFPHYLGQHAYHNNYSMRPRKPGEHG